MSPVESAAVLLGLSVHALQQIRTGKQDLAKERMLPAKPALGNRQSLREERLGLRGSVNQKLEALLG